jgi:O-antigen ligase
MLPPGSIYAEYALGAARACLVVAAGSLALSTAATNAFAVLAFLFWAVSGRWQPAARAIAAEPPAWLGLLLLALLGIGVAWSLAPRAAALDMVVKYRELALFGIVMFLCMEPRWRDRVLGAALAGALVLLALSSAIQLGLLEYADERGFSAPDNAVLLKNPITHGVMMSLVAFAGAELALRRSGAWRWALALVAALAAFNVWFGVQGRTGYVVMAVLMLWFAWRRWAWKGLAGGVLALALVVASAWLWAPAFQERVSLAVSEAQQYPTAPQTHETSIGYRLHFWKRSAQWLAGHPLAGAGTGGWGEAFYEATASDPALLHDRTHTHPHNEYVHLAVQLGPLGLALYLALLWASYRRAATLPEPYALLAQGFVIAFALASLFNDVLRDTTEGHMWALLGGALFGASRALRRA